MESLYLNSHDSQQLKDELTHGYFCLKKRLKNPSHLTALRTMERQLHHDKQLITQSLRLWDAEGYRGDMMALNKFHTDLTQKLERLKYLHGSVTADPAIEEEAARDNLNVRDEFQIPSQMDVR